jgi:hypothetical protein
MANSAWEDAEIISVYSRAQAIEDGVLVDVTPIARRLCGFRYPVAVTRALFEDAGDGIGGLLRSVTAAALKAKPGEDMVTLEFQGLTVWSICGPGDTAAPVVTIMYPEDY